MPLKAALLLNVRCPAPSAVKMPTRLNGPARPFTGEARTEPDPMKAKVLSGRGLYTSLETREHPMRRRQSRAGEPAREGPGFPTRLAPGRRASPGPFESSSSHARGDHHVLSPWRVKRRMLLQSSAAPTWPVG